MFDIAVYKSIRITDDIEFLITETTRNMWIVMALLFLHDRILLVIFGG